MKRLRGLVDGSRVTSTSRRGAAARAGAAWMRRDQPRNNRMNQLIYIYFLSLSSFARRTLTDRRATALAGDAMRGELRA